MDLPVVVAVPGTLCAPAIYDRLAARLAGRVTVDAVDWLLGAGPWELESVAERIAKAIAARYGGPVLLAGHSTGGAVAQLVALDHPELVAGLLLIDTGAHMHGHGDVDRVLRAIETDWGPALRGAVLDRSFATGPDPSDRADLLAYAGRLTRGAALDAVRSQRALDLTPRLATLRVPTAVVHGTLDPTRTPAQARELADAVPGATLRLLDTGHSPQYEAPDAVAAEVVALAERAGLAGRVMMRTERLLLRRFTPSDVDNLVALDGDPAVMRYLTGGRGTPREEVERDVLPGYLAYDRPDPGYGFFAMIERASGRFVGWLHLRPDEGAPPDEPELGYRLRADAWGRGYATEASLAVLRHGFTELGARRVVAETMAVNSASRRVMEKCGLRYVRTFFQDWPDRIEGDEQGDVEYAVDREVWLAEHPG